MQTIEALVIGAGQAGLAMSHELAARGVEHVVLERGRVAERWRSERWDSLRMLTPNWMSRLPGWAYAGPDPQGFMTMPEVAAYLGAYARSFDAPVRTGATVYGVRRTPGGYRVSTSGGSWQARAVIVATGHCDVPMVPALAAGLPDALRQITTSSYRSPDTLPPGGALVVGASASGVQIAEQIHRSGRPVSLAVGHHTRLPRTYRGRDILDWFERAGILSEAVDGTRNPARARAQPSLQLVGSPEHRSLDLATLQGIGVRLLGRALAMQEGVLHLARDLADTVAAAQGTMERMLARIDPVADREGAPSQAWPAPFCPAPAPEYLDLRAEGIRTVVWATGYARRYGWLQVPVFDTDGEIRHAGGVTAAPGLYALGLRFQRTRRSNFLDGVGADASALAAHIEGYLASSTRNAA